MYCRTCGYELSGLSAGPCPECGSAFDPNVPASFEAESGPGRVPRAALVAVLLGSAGPLVWILLVHAALVAARLELGRWPHRMGMDDPSALRGIGRAGWLLGAYGIALVPLSVGVALVGMVVCWLRRRREMSLAVVLTLLGAWALAFVIGRADPAQACAWFFD